MEIRKVLMKSVWNVTKGARWEESEKEENAENIFIAYNDKVRVEK